MPPTSRLHTFACVLIYVLSTTGVIRAQQAVSPRVTKPLDNAVRTTLAGNVHPLARPEFDHGEAPSDLALERILLVLRRGPVEDASLRRFIESQQNQSSSDYHRWLTPEEIGTQFGPADSDIGAVVDWLKSSGFDVTQISKGRTAIEFSGTAGQVKQAFGASIHKYVVNGETHWANDRDLSVPTAIAPIVAGINSLHNFRKKPQNSFVGVYSENGKHLTSAPNFTFLWGGYTYYALAPYDFAKIYDLLPLWTAAPTPINGSGQTIAIVGRTDIDPSDATTFWNLFGLDGIHAPQPSLTITYNGPNPGINEDEGEADIDTQWSGAAAPGASINFVTSESTETTDGVDLSALYIVDNNVASIISESYGLCETYLGSAGTEFYSSLWEQAAAQGISVFVSSGDNGSAGCDYPDFRAQYGLNVNGLASTQFNVSVGGTDFNQYNKEPTYWNSSNDPVTQASAKGYIPETTWNSSCVNSLFVTLGWGSDAESACNNLQLDPYWVNSIAGSGGRSAAWLKPSWQTGTPNDNARDLPDISLFASNGFMGSFYVVCQKDQTGGVCDLNNIAAFGGTSVASPALAGIMALVNQKWGVQGNPNFVLYKLPAKQANAFHDTPLGSTNAVPCQRGTPDCATNKPGDAIGVLTGFNTSRAYDLATGLGSVDAANLVNNWTKVTFTSSITTLSLNSGNPVNITHGTAVPVHVSVTPTNPTPTGSAALLVAPGTPGNPGIDSFELSNGGTSSNTSMLPGGIYAVLAHYSGDGTYGGSYSPSVNVTVNPENSSVYMPGLVTNTDSNNKPVYSTSVPYGSPYLLRADVKTSQGKLCNPFAEVACPTGTMTFTVNGDPLDAGTYPMNASGYAEDHVIQLAGGTYTLGGSYSGDASYNPSSTSSSVTITPAPTSFNDIHGSGQIVNQPFPISAEIIAASSGVSEGGTFTFFVDGVALTGDVIYGYSGGCGTNYVCLDAHIDDAIVTTPGRHSVSAHYNGDSNYAPSSSEAVGFSAYYPTTMALAADPQNPQPGASTMLTALVDTPAKNLTPTGTVNFLSDYGGQTLPGKVTLTPVTDENGNSALQATLSYVPTSNHSSFAAFYSGDSNYLDTGAGPYAIVVAGSDFSFNPQAKSTVVSPGQTVVMDLIIDGQLDYNGTIKFAPSSVQGLPAETNATFSTSTVTGSGYTTLEVTTTAPHTAMTLPAGSGRGGWLAGAGLLAAAVFLLPVPRRKGLNLLVAVIAFVFLTTTVSCGGGGSSGNQQNNGGGGMIGGTPVGSYVITVSATDGTHTHPATFTLTVQ